MSALIKRHTMLFLKDKMSVFFSLLSVFIIIGLYLLFLSENLTANLPEFPGRSTFVFVWMFAGIIAVTTATASLGALGKFIEDKENNKREDFLITKITPRKLAYSYIIYTFIIGLIFTIILIAFGYIYTMITFDNNLIISLQLVAVVLLSTLMHTLLFYLIISRIKSMNAFTGFSTIVGTMIGFLAGIYIPIGILPGYIQKVITVFPTTQAATLLKDILMVDVLDSMQTLMPQKVYDETAVMLGIKLQWNEKILSTNFSWIYLIGITILLLVLVLINRRNQK